MALPEPTPRSDAPVPTPELTSSSTVGRRWALVAGAIAVLSLVPRLQNLGAPLLDRHDFRQSQTALTVQANLDRGVRVFDYETPVFGPPWQVPFEFPTYQLSATAVAALGVPLDLACRSTALAWFYLSAFLLFLAVRRFLGPPLATLALAAYVLSPFSVIWSRACSIDYTSVALALGYLLLAAAWAERPRRAVAAAAILVGALAYATKLTSVVGFALPLALVLLGALVREWRAARPGAVNATRARLLGWLAALTALPLAAGTAWTKWCDRIKDAHQATQWLTSSRLDPWLFGTLEQRADLANWIEIGDRIRTTVLPGLFVFTAALALVALVRSRGSARLALTAAFVGGVAPIVVFFNLFKVHDYYLICATPFLAVIAGAGLLQLAALRFPGRIAVLAAAAVAAVVSARESWEYVRPTFEASSDWPIARIGRTVAAITGPEEWVAIEGDDWNPRVLYAAHRRGFFLRPPSDVRLFADRTEWGAFVCVTCPPDALALWPRRRWVASDSGFDIFKVWPAAAGGPAGLEGSTEHAGCDRIEGWVWNPGTPRYLTEIEILDGKRRVVATAATGRFALELAKRGIYDGRHGFSVGTPDALRDGREHEVSVRVAGSGFVLPGTAHLRCPKG